MYFIWSVIYNFGEIEIEGALEEGRTIQCQLKQNPPKQQEDTARIFAKLMMEGKARAAL